MPNFFATNKPPTGKKATEPETTPLPKKMWYPMPPSTNKSHRKNKSLRDETLNFREIVSLANKRAEIYFGKQELSLEIAIHWGKRIGDINNRVKQLEDALQPERMPREGQKTRRNLHRYYIIKDDKQIKKTLIYEGKRANIGYITVIFRKYEPTEDNGNDEKIFLELYKGLYKIEGGNEDE